MKDQAAELRDVVRRNINQTKNEGFSPRTITVTSGKGGVGKSNIVVNLAVQLGKMGKKVVILDADLGLANAEILLGVAPAYSIYDVIIGEKTIEEIVVDAPCDITLIPGGNGFQELANLERDQLENMLTSLKRYVEGYDYLLIDTGAGISKNVLGFVAAAQEVIVVTTPEPTSLTDAYTMIKILSKYKIHPTVSMIINRAKNLAEAQQTMKKIDIVAAKFLQIEVKHLGNLYEDKLVGNAVKSQQPFISAYPNSRASRDINHIACGLLDIKGENVSGMNRMITKLMQLFG